MAKNQQVGLETVNAYGAEGLPASFELSVNRGDTVVRVGFNIRSINGQNLYVSDMVNSADVDLVENGLKGAKLQYRKSNSRRYGSNGTGKCRNFQLLSANVVAFLRDQQRR